MLCSGKEIKSYKLLEENFPPSPPIKDAKLYVLNPATDTIKVYITDLNGIPKELQSGGISSDNYVNSLQFNSENGVLTAGRNFLSALNTSLDGRYLQPGDNISSLNNDAGYITSQFSPSTLLNDYGFADNSANWNTAFSWGDHSTQGYLTSLTFSGLTDYPTDEVGALTNDGVGNLSWQPHSYVSQVALNGNLLNFTGIGSAYNNSVDLSSLAGTPPIDLLSTTQIFDLGEIGASLIEDAFNAFVFPVNVQNQIDGYVIINTLRSGTLVQYLFLAEGGNYGSGGVLTAVAADFAELSNLNVNLTWQHASSTFGASSDVTQNLIPGQATSFTSVVVHNAAIMSPEMVTNTIKNKGFAGLDIGGNGSGSSVFAVRIKGSNPNNGNVEIGDSTNDIDTWNPISESRKNTVALKRSYKPTAGAVLTSAGDFQFTGVYANNPVNFDVNGEDPNSYYAAFESNPIITGTHLAANPQKIYALRGKGRVLLTDYGSNNVTGTPTYNLAVDASGNVIETALSGTTSGETGTEINDLTAAVVWANVPNVNITESSVTQHQSALSITESQISDLSHFSPSDLATDYSFIDNSSNWNTAYAWGDHSVVGYLSSIPTMEQTAAMDGNVSSDVNFNGGTVTYGDGTNGFFLGTNSSYGFLSIQSTAGFVIGDTTGTGASKNFYYGQNGFGIKTEDQYAFLKSDLITTPTTFQFPTTAGIIPISFTDGTTTFLSNNAGEVDLSSLRNGIGVDTLQSVTERGSSTSEDITFTGSLTFVDAGSNYLGTISDSNFSMLHGEEITFLTTSSNNLVSLHKTNGLELRSLFNVKVKLGDGSNYTNPTIGQVLSAADTDGNLKWTDMSSGGSVAGNDTEIQFNNNGVFGASENFIWDGSTLKVSSNDSTYKGIQLHWVGYDTPAMVLTAAGNITTNSYGKIGWSKTPYRFTSSQNAQDIYMNRSGDGHMGVFTSTSYNAQLSVNQNGSSNSNYSRLNLTIDNNGDGIISTQAGGTGTQGDLILNPLSKVTVNGNVIATSFIKTDATSDDILLGDGSTTSLSTLTANNTNIYNSHGSIPANVIRNVTMSTSSILNFQSSTDGGQVVISDSGVKSLFAVTTTDIQLANDSIEILANGTDIASIQGKNGLKLDMTDSGGSETLAVVNNGLLTSYGGTWNPDSNTTTDAVGGGTGSLSDATGVMNVEYVVVVKGATIDLGSGSESYDIGDVVAFDGVKWIKKVDNNQVGGVINASQYRLSTLNTAPTSATDTGTLGEIRVASDYIYVCTATDTWVRTALTTW